MREVAVAQRVARVDMGVIGDVDRVRTYGFKPDLPHISDVPGGHQDDTAPPLLTPLGFQASRERQGGSQRGLGIVGGDDDDVGNVEGVEEIRGGQGVARVDDRLVEPVAQGSPYGGKLNGGEVFCSLT